MCIGVLFWDRSASMIKASTSSFEYCFSATLSPFVFKLVLDFVVEVDIVFFKALLPRRAVGLSADRATFHFFLDFFLKCPMLNRFGCL